MPIHTICYLKCLVVFFCEQLTFTVFQTASARAENMVRGVVGRLLLLIPEQVIEALLALSPFQSLVTLRAHSFGGSLDLPCVEAPSEGNAADVAFLWLASGEKEQHNPSNDNHTKNT